MYSVFKQGLGGAGEFGGADLERLEVEHISIQPYLSTHVSTWNEAHIVQYLGTVRSCVLLHDFVKKIAYISTSRSSFAFLLFRETKK